MTNATDERRARVFSDVMAKILEEEPIPWDKLGARTREELLLMMASIRASDAEAGMVLVPRQSLQSIYDDHMAGQSGVAHPHASHLSLHALATLMLMIAAHEGDG